MTSVTELLQKYTFEPVTTTTKFDQHTLPVKHQDRVVPFGHFKLRLKNIDNQQNYDLVVRQRLQLTAPSGFQLRSRLHGIHVTHDSQAKQASHQIVTTLKINRTTTEQSALKHDHASQACPIPVTNRVAKNLPDQVPLYAFTDSHQVTINQQAMAQLFLQAIGHQNGALAS